MGKGSLPKVDKRRLRRALNGQTKPGKRRANGRLSEAADARPREPKAPPPVVVARMRDHGLGEGDARTAYAGSGHGLLLLAGIITPEGFNVAERYRRLRHAYQRVTFRGPKEAASAALPYRGEYQGGRQSERAEGDGLHDAHSDILEGPEEREARIRRDWEAVEACLAFCGPSARVLNDVAVLDEDIRHDARDIRWLILALEALASLWGQDPSSMTPRG